MPSNAPSKSTPTNATAGGYAVVSNEADQLILVDENDVQTGTLSKAKCHDGAGHRHRAFSLFIFSATGDVLLQQRAAGKRLWPLYWSNSCCSHPRAGETADAATHRRLQEELGLSASLDYLYRFEYVARYGDLGSEHELCSVYAGHTDQTPAVNPTEIADWRWVAPGALSTELAQHPDRFTPWFQLEWQHICREFSHLLQASATTS
ncbi:MAG: isopentenyl-diphosphate Delta-isomerase [Pseudomonadales bacterium]